MVAKVEKKKISNSIVVEFHCTKPFISGPRLFVEKEKDCLENGNSDDHNNGSIFWPCGTYTVKYCVGS